jgi:D-3-phosphoglycerate dehydrogenase
MLHTIISGIPKLAEDTDKKVKEFSTVSYEEISSENELILALSNCDIFWFRLNHKITAKTIEDVKCKFILCAATGLDHIDVNACNNRGIEIISLKGESGFLKEVRATAEHTLGLLLSLIRKSKRAFEHVEQGNWNRYLYQGSELYKKKIGIYGLGRLGKILAEYYYVLGMDVFYYDTKEEYIAGKFIKTSSAKELFSIVDYVSIHLPYNEETHFIINKELLKYLKSSACIVNTARGGVVNENDLLNLIKEGKIGGYATDVLYGEPEVANHPLVLYAKKNENVIITPHIAGNTFESIEKTEAFVLGKLIKKLITNK